MVDLHTHSNVSDGELTPELLVKEAVKQGLQAFALTDHDTIDGLERAKNAALAEGICFIPGIEANINWKTGSMPRDVPGLGPGGEFHLLGLGIKPNPAFTAVIGELFRRREERNLKIMDKMHELSIEASWDELLALADSIGNNGQPDDAQSSALSSTQSGSRSLGRPHFANLLVKKKIVKSVDQAFSRYLGVGKPLYVPKDGLAFEEAAALIRESGGIPVLAHPMSLYIAWGRLPEMVKALKDRGLMGIEAWHPLAKQNSCRRLEALGKSLGLYITEGSDFHGLTRPGRKLGYSGRGRPISEAVVQAIPELAQF